MIGVRLVGPLKELKHVTFLSLRRRPKVSCFPVYFSLQYHLFTSKDDKFENLGATTVLEMRNVHLRFPSMTQKRLKLCCLFTVEL